LDKWSFNTGSIFDFHKIFILQFGVLWPLSFVAAGYIIITARKQSPLVIYIAGFFFSFQFLTYRFGFWEPRYLLVLLFIGSILSGIFLKSIVIISSTFPHSSPYREKYVNMRKKIPSLIIAASVAGGLGVQSSFLFPLIRDNYLLDRHEFFNTHSRFYSVARWANSNLGNDDRIAMMGPQPFYFLDKPYFHIHPLSEKGDFQSAETVHDLCKRFHDIGISHISYLPDIEPGGGKMPHVNKFESNILLLLDQMEQASLIKKITSIDKASIMSVDCPRE